jgi:hypothetical protein
MYKTTAAILMLISGAMSTSGAFAQAAAGDPPDSVGAADVANAAARAEALEARYAEVEAEMRALQERLAVLARDYAALGGAVAPKAAQPSGSIRETEQELARLEVELAALRRQFTDTHPRVQLLLRQIEATEGRLAAMSRAQAARGDAEAERRLEAEVAARRAAERRADEENLRAELTRLEAEWAATRAAEQRAQALIAAQANNRPQAEPRPTERDLQAEFEARLQAQRGLFGNTPRYPSSAAWDAMQLVTLTPLLGEYFGTESGILVLRQPADESLGLRDGDVILDIGGREPTTPEHTLRILSSFVPGETLTLQIMRNGQRETREIALPAADAQPAENGGGFPSGGLPLPAPSPPSPPVRPSPEPPPPAPAIP